MSAKTEISSKHAAIDKNNTRIVVATAVASALAVFALVGGHSMISRMAYQRRVAKQQNAAIAQLKDDLSSINTLVNQYKIFSTANPNMLGVSSDGTTGDQGSNGRIVLDGLPSQYDFPALASSIEKILAGRGLQPTGLGGKDNGTTGTQTASPNPQPQSIRFNFSVATDYQTSKNLVADFERSIRPFKVITIGLSGTNSKLSLNVTMDTYYQPIKTLNISTKEVK